MNKACFCTYRSGLCAGLVLALLAGPSACSRQSTTTTELAPEEGSVPEVVIAKNPTTSAGGEPAQQPAVETKITSTTAPILLTAILDAGGKIQVGLRHLETDQTALVRLGGNFAGYTVKEVHPDRQCVVLERNGEQCEISLNTATDPEVGDEPMQLVSPASPMTTQVSWPTSNLPAMGATVKYRATKDEQSRGIDPNNASTWPEDYRGPGIERAMRGLPIDQ